MSLEELQPIEHDESSKREGRPFRHLTARAYDPESGVFQLQSESKESRLGTCFQSYPLGGADEGTMSRLKSVLTSNFPADTFIQFGLFSEPDISDAMSCYMSQKYRATGLLETMAQRRAEFLRGGVFSPIPGTNEILLCRQRLIFSVSIPSKASPTPEEFALISDISNKLKEGMSSVGFHMTQMDEETYLALIRRFFRLYSKDDFSLDDYTPTREQVFAPADHVYFGKDDITFNDGEYYAKMLSIKSFPKTAGIGLMNMLVGDPFGSASNQITDPFWLSATIRYPDQHKKASQMRFKHIMITNQSFGGMAHLIPKLRYKKEGMDILINDMDNGGNMLCEVNFTMTMFSRDKKRLSGLISSWRAWASSYGFDMREDRRILKELFYSLLPLGTTVKGMHDLFRLHTMGVTHAIHNLPIIGNWIGTGRNGSSVFTSRRGPLALFDPYDATTNYNGVIAAAPGGGKSFVAQQLLCDWMAGGARAWVIDQGRSYQKLCRAVGGQFIEFSNDSDVCLNPFTKIADIDEEMDILKAMFAKMAAPEDGLDDLMLSALESKIKAAYSTAGNKASADMVAQQCLNDPDQRIRDIGTMLFPYTRGGTYGRWFNGENNVDFDNNFVVLELQELANKKNLQQVVLLQLMSTIGDAMYHTHGRKKYLLIDEGWALIDDPMMGKAIEAAYRKVRKHEGGAWLITQAIADLYESAVGRALINNSVFQIILRQKTEAVDSAVKNGHLKMSPYQVAQLKAVHTSPGKYAEMMIRADDDWGIVRLVVDRFSQILFSTKGWERDLVFERMDAGEDVVDIIDSFIKEGK